MSRPAEKPAAGAMPAERLSQAREEVFASRAALLKLHATRIGQALADVREGLGREWREPDAPSMDDYVRRLSSYRERQTVELLSAELDTLLVTDAASDLDEIRPDLAEVILIDNASTDGSVQMVREHFPLSPAGIIDHLQLRRPVFRVTTAGGHFGRQGDTFTWEKTDKADVLAEAAGLVVGAAEPVSI